MVLVVLTVEVVVDGSGWLQHQANEMCGSGWLYLDGGVAFLVNSINERNEWGGGGCMAVLCLMVGWSVYPGINVM